MSHPSNKQGLNDFHARKASVSDAGSEMFHGGNQGSESSRRGLDNANVPNTIPSAPRYTESEQQRPKETPFNTRPMSQYIPLHHRPRHGSTSDGVQGIDSLRLPPEILPSIPPHWLPDQPPDHRGPIRNPIDNNLPYSSYINAQVSSSAIPDQKLENYRPQNHTTLQPGPHPANPFRPKFNAPWTNIQPIRAQGSYQNAQSLTADQVSAHQRTWTLLDQILNNQNAMNQRLEKMEEGFKEIKEQLGRIEGGDYETDEGDEGEETSSV